LIDTGDKFLERCRGEATQFIEELVDEAGASGVVVAMSGGIDSSLVAALAAEALPESDIFGVGLPEGGTTPPGEMEDARDLAESLGVKWGSVDVAPAVDAVEAAGGELCEPNENARINVAPRVRMALTYFVANSRNLLVLGTGNRSERLLGYFTKYGDGAADTLPIGDLYKTQVFALADYLGLPEHLVEKEPSAGLYVGQTDAKELGFDYDELDPVLHLLYDEGYSVREAAEETLLSVDEVEAMRDRVERNQHKRESPPVPDLSDRKKG